MNIITADKLSFTYHGGNEALNGISLSVAEGEFVTLCGSSGCGKSTLLRLMKPALSPRGKTSGKIAFFGEDISSLSEYSAACDIGFVMQDPESQIVTDKVWHELAFAPESIGLPQGEIRRRVAEMACYFGIEELFEQSTTSLSGGQKQLLALASAVSVHPKLLLLDEPTSMLDPIAAQTFIDTVSRLNRDLGVTVIIAEHRLEELLPVSDRVIVMEHGSIIADCHPREICSVLPQEHSMLLAMPVAVRLYSRGGGENNAPLSVREGRNNAICRKAIEKLFPDTATSHSIEGEILISARDLWVSYDRNSPDVLKRASLDVCAGRIYAVLGGNGSGKTTLLKCLAGMIRPLGGKVKRKKDITTAFLPQNPCELFTEDTAREELMSVTEQYNDIAERFGLIPLLDNHPYDLSGGERQRLALAKLMLKKPDVLLLDEPTKGMDAASKEHFSDMLYQLATEGMAVVLVTHDTELAAKCADVCGMLFNGEMINEASPSEFFAENYFYTTPARRITRGIREGIISLDRSKYESD